MWPTLNILDPDYLLENELILIGSPDTVAEKLRRWGEQGSFNTFLYNDPTDNITTNQVLAAGDGSTTLFQLQRSLISSTNALFTEPVTQPNQVTAVYVGGTAVAYSLGAYGQVHLATPPAAGAIVSASFSYFWPVRFLADTYEFENFLLGLWTLKKIQFKSVLLP